MAASAPAIGEYGIFGRAVGDPAKRAEVVAELEESGFGTLWLANSGLGEVGPWLAADSELTVATGIASIWAHDAEATAGQFAALESAHPGRVLLGLGVSHAPMAAGYSRPYSAMQAYLDTLDTPGTTVPPERRVLAALGPKMLRLSAERAAGAFPYLVTADFVEQAREVVGDDAVLAPELGVILETDPGRARETARSNLALYLPLPNYTKSWLREGFTEDDLADGGSDRLVDALFAWGDDERIRARVNDFRAAGADHVACQIITPGRESPEAPVAQWRRLAALLPS